MLQKTDAIALERPRPRLRLAVLAIPLLVAAGTIASFLGAYWWVFECLAHFRPHWAGLSLLTLAYCSAVRSRLAGVIALVCLVVNTAPLAPYLFAYDTASALTRSVRVMSANLHGDDRALRRLQALIAQEQPDIVLLTEVPPSFPAVPLNLFPQYPETFFSRHGAFEVVLLSRWTVKDSHLDRRLAQLPILTTELCDPENPATCLNVIGLHGARPFGRTVQWRDVQLERAAEVAAALADQPVLLMGDLNVTPWSPVFARLLDAGNLRDASRARGLTTTWPASCLWCGVLIDHILVNPKIAVIQSRVAADIGSDHRPVVAEIAFR
jgi:endonuclease/exonuclease/phosphatase (EEP) superfamily protein YafD